jgi:Polyketide synthase modules and related proteins
MIKMAHSDSQDLGFSIFSADTINMLANYLTRSEEGESLSLARRKRRGKTENEDIAIIGMSCRFPGAKDVNNFWQNLVDGIESISSFSDEEIQIHDRELLDNPDYVKAGAITT